MLGDLASSLVGGGGGSENPVDENADAVLEAAVGPSWEDVRSRLESAQTPEERRFRDDLAKGHGAASPMHKIRLYDDSNDESDVRVTFYRDSASWCPYCQKVWFALEEKRIPYRVEKVNMSCYGSKPREFLRMQPNGQIPVAVIDGRVLRSSDAILAELEDSFPEHKSLLPPPASRDRARELLGLEQSLAGAWLGYLRGGPGDRAYLERTLARVEEALAENADDGPFFLGADVTIVDVQFVSFMERLCSSLLFFKGLVVRVPPGDKNRAYPAINAWFDALEERDSYRVGRSDHYTHCWDLPPQLGGCTAEPAGAPHRATINGEDGSWTLPLKPHAGGIEPDWTWAGGDDEAAARREAVERLSANHEAIVAFAARGAGKKGSPPVMAALADPNAEPDPSVVAGVDAALRAVSSTMLEGDATATSMSSMDGLVRSAKGRSDAYVRAVVDSLAYLRDRVGVPRDMRLPAARQLRAHLNWAIACFEDGGK